MDLEVISRLKQLFHNMLPSIQENVRSLTGLMPVAFILYDKVKVDVAGMLFCDNDEKRRIYEEIDKTLRLRKAEGVILANEAWAARVEGVKNSEEAHVARRAMPASLKDQPGRKEILIVTLITHEWQEAHNWEIIRDGEKITFGKEDVFEQDVEQNLLKYFKQGGTEKWKSKLN